MLPLKEGVGGVPWWLSRLRVWQGHLLRFNLEPQPEASACHGCDKKKKNDVGDGEHTLEIYGQLASNILQVHFNLPFICLMFWAELHHIKRCAEVLPPGPW